MVRRSVVSARGTRSLAQEFRFKTFFGDLLKQGASPWMDRTQSRQTLALRTWSIQLTYAGRTTVALCNLLLLALWGFYIR
jgi:hypothetical protein